jgi:tetratricopeptide (TPR) repeat protein
MKLKKYILSTALLCLLGPLLAVSPGFSGDKKQKAPTEKEKHMQADLFAKSLIEKEKGNLEEAFKLINQSLEIISGDAAANYEKARLLLAMGRKDEALEFSEISVNNDPSNKWYKVLYAKIAKVNDKYDDYVKVYEELVNEYPTDLDFLQELAFAYYFTGDYKKSVDVYDKIEDLMGMNEGISKQKAELYDRLGKTEEAIQEYEKLITYNPNQVRYYALLAEYSTKTKNNKKAIQAYQKILELNPDDPYVHISLADFYRKEENMEQSFNELKLGLANKELDLNTKINILISYYNGSLNEEQKKQALELSEILKATHPDDPLSETFYASMLYENKEYSKARGLFVKILDSNATNYSTWEQLLFSDLYLEDYKMLAEDSEKAIEYFPSYPLPWFFAGAAHFQNKDYQKAIERLNSGKDFVVNNNALLEQFYATLGDSYHAIENFKASYEAYDKTLSLNAENTVVLNNYAYYLSLRKENLDKAESMSQKAVELDPYNNNNLDTYAWVLFQNEKYKEALNWIQKAYQNGGESSAVVNEHYGDIHFKLGNTDEALKYWNIAKTKIGYSDLLDKKIKDKTFYE